MAIDLYPIILTARKGNWRKFQDRKQSKRFLSVQKQIFKRDNNSCRFCGFISEKYQEVVNLDQDYTHNTLSNLVTSCSFCAQCFFLDGVGTNADTGGEIIHCPEISQTDLNNFCRVLFCSMDKETPYKNKLQSVYLSLRDRKKAIEDCFGPESSTPKVFGQGLIDTQLDQEKLQHPLMKEVKLLPLKRVFKEPIDYWKKTIFAKLPL